MTASGTTLPALFVSHGSPMFAIEVGQTGPVLGHWGDALARSVGERLRGVVIMSPHWMARVPTVMATAQPETWHDFGGFAPALYALQYPARGDPALAAEVIALLAVAGIAAQPDAERPMDHGAWVPLMHLFPDADLPVVQVALPGGAGPAEVLAMGQALASLRRHGVLVIGSGSMTHNLGEISGGDREPAPYVLAFSRWVEAAVLRGDLAALLDYRRLAPQAQRAHPSEEHFLPIFFALGAGRWGEAESPRVDWLSREVMSGVLAMDAFSLSPAH